MVLFINVNLNQRVEVKIDNSYILKGTVRYKGQVVTKKGDWVGVELDRAVGMHCGLYQGRRYFQCMTNHGIFVRASQLRFIPMTRCLYHKYQSVRDTPDDPYVDETLFGSNRERSIQNMVSNKEVIPFEERFTPDNNFSEAKLFQPSRSFPLRHSVSNHIPPSNKRPHTAISTYRSLRPYIHDEYDVAYDFIDTPSVPKTHMPFSALKRQVNRGWENAHYVREMTVGTGRDSIKFHQWNDITD